jgi:hypothetical protein
MDYFSLTETQFFQQITNAQNGGDLEVAYRDFVRATFDLCTGTASRHELLFALNFIETELQSLYECSRLGLGKLEESNSCQVFVRKALLFIHRTLEQIQNQMPELPLSKNTNQASSAPNCRWTGSTVELVELIYGLTEMKSINNGELPITELVTLFASQFGIEIKDCYSAYVDIKRRKNDSRTYYLDKMRERLNLRMQLDDEREKSRR